MAINTVSSWRELDDAISEISRPRSERHAHSTVVFRGLARTDYSHVSSLARLRGDYPALERHLLRNFRKYAHRRAPGPALWDWLPPRPADVGLARARPAPRAAHAPARLDVLAARGAALRHRFVEPRRRAVAGR